MGNEEGEDGETACILTAGRPRPFCAVCQVDIVDSPKAIKQHLKSKPHKAAVKGGQGGAENSAGVGRRKKGSKAVQDAEDGDGGESDVDRPAGEAEDKPCQVCQRVGRTNTRHSIASLRAALEQGLDVMPCFPPPFERAPKSLFPGCRRPFVSLQSGRIEEVPEDLEACLDLYCNAGANEGNKPPNIDINGENIKAKSLSNARRALLQASSAGEMFWAALVVDAIAHPPWWPRPRKDNCACCDDGDVPNFNQVIIGSGETDIGIHIDNAPRPCTAGAPGRDYDMVDAQDPQYKSCLSAGDNSVHVDTYITMARGCKHVIMLPSGGNFFGEKSPFPRSVDPELMQKILDQGGYFFNLEPIDDQQHVTLFTPKGWHHWLLGKSDWHLIFGASRF
jgi:hypothetical protein